MRISDWSSDVCSSDLLDAGYVTYSNEAKLASLHVSSDVIETFGSVSIAVAWSMAQGVLEQSGADVAVAITGIAGPGGGSEKKPVGRVVFARAERGAAPADVIAEARSAVRRVGEESVRRSRARWSADEYRKKGIRGYSEQ